MSHAFEVVQAGLLTTVQDLGRFGCRQSGLSAAGAMDAFALEVGNLLVGNRRDEAALEIAMTGPTLRALDDLVVAVTGADLGATADGVSAPLWQAFALGRGQEMRFRGASHGMWACLAVAGGIDVPRVLGSRSTYLRGGLGGFKGRALARGDIIERGDASRPAGGLLGRAVPTRDVPEYTDDAAVRVILGPQEDAFTEAGVRAFLSSAYEVTRQSDRMGYRLRGPAIAHRAKTDIISDAVAPGSVQVPSDGQPIVLLADCQTTGGYAKIATVISTDLPFVAQLRPGGKVSFRAVAVEEAQVAAVEREERLQRLESGADIPVCHP